MKNSDQNYEEQQIQPSEFRDLSFTHLMIVDLEATCCEEGTIPRHANEIIEIGAVMLDAESLEIIDQYEAFVRPVRYPVLTQFCTELTSITQPQVDSAPEYKEAVKPFQKWMNGYSDILFCSWGDYDRNQFIRDSVATNLPYPIEAPHLNIKKLFSFSQQRERWVGMSIALELCGLELEGTHHRGIDDARNMARMMPYILGRKKIPHAGADTRTL
ncbi:3'-5' exonuclease [Allohahella marinimesophila]|uniref:Exonuclease domain-containing protein n=1 Tax=Allohahella marinimesophila TaxID=1054972 RepID=A0ABP7Q711_9GAMM